MPNIKQQRKEDIQENITYLTRHPDSLVRTIEITKIKDGSAVVTLSWEDNWCFAAEKAFRSRFINGNCKPNYVIGEISFGDKLHEKLHHSVKTFNKEGEPTAHYHIHVKKFRHVEQFLTDLKKYQLEDVFSRDRDKIAKYSNINPYAFFQQLNQPGVCLEQKLVEPSEMSYLLNKYNFSLDMTSNQLSNEVPKNCTDGYLSPAFYLLCFSYWAMACALLLQKILRPDNQAERPQPENIHNFRPR